MIVAIDGPAASGKTTVARFLARLLNFKVLHSGEIYRAFAWAACRHGIKLNDEKTLTDLAGYIDIKIDGRADHPRTLIGGVDITEVIQSPELANAASNISKLTLVHERMVVFQQNLAWHFGDCVAEGRDMTTVVFTFAQVMVYLDADLTERARRRQAEFAAQGRVFCIQDVKADLADRDFQDSNRSIAPLRRIASAHYLDSTSLTVAEVVDRIVALVDDSHDARSGPR